MAKVIVEGEATSATCELSLEVRVSMALHHSHRHHHGGGSRPRLCATSLVDVVVAREAAPTKKRRITSLTAMALVAASLACPTIEEEEGGSTLRWRRSGRWAVLRLAKS